MITPTEEPSRPITPAKKTTPLPPIAASGVPNVPIVFIMGTFIQNFNIRLTIEVTAKFCDIIF